MMVITIDVFFLNLDESFDVNHAKNWFDQSTLSNLTEKTDILLRVNNMIVRYTQMTFY